MPGDVTVWNKTAASNASADPSINWAEGQPKSSINDSARAVMAAIASWRDDLYGRNVTGGSGNVYTIALSQDVSSYRNGLSFLVVPDHANIGPGVTLSADGGSALSWVKVGGATFEAGEISVPSLHWVMYNAISTRFETIVSWPHKHSNADLTSSVAALDDFFAATDAATARAAIGAQTSLGFTPIQQGGGSGQLNNKVYIGYSASGRLKAQVDSSDIGELFTTTTDGAGSGLDADMLDGKHASEFSNANNQTTPDVLDYPIGCTLFVAGAASARNANIDVYYFSSGGVAYQIGSGTAKLNGTWRSCGSVNAGGTFVTLAQRVA